MGGAGTGALAGDKRKRAVVHVVDQGAATGHATIEEKSSPKDGTIQPGDSMQMDQHVTQANETGNSMTTADETGVSTTTTTTTAAATGPASPTPPDTKARSKLSINASKQHRVHGRFSKTPDSMPDVDSSDGEISPQPKKKTKTAAKTKTPRKAMVPEEPYAPDASGKKAEETPPVIPTEVRRSGRARAAPKDVYTETASLDVAEAPKSASKKRPTTKKAGTASAGKRATTDRKWDPEFLTTNPKSPYATMEVGPLFTQSVWELLTAEEQQTLLKSLPESALVYAAPEPVSDGALPQAQLRPDFWLNNEPLQIAIKNWQEDLGYGRYKPQYVAEAAEARRRRMAGEFDNWKDNHFEEWWGQRQKLTYSGAIAGEASGVKLETLLKHGALKIGDVFSYRRTFYGIGTLRKDAELTAFDNETYAMTFSYPPGNAEFTSTGVPNITVDKVRNVTGLANGMMRCHSQCPAKIPNGNAFKEFRILRRHEDIGSLFEVRQAFYQAYLAPSDENTNSNGAEKGKSADKGKGVE